MSEARKPLYIGMFIFSGIMLFVLAVFALSRDNIFSRPVEYVVYFTGALDGLEIGADVTYRGVKVGSVQSISLSYDKKVNDVVMPVIIRISSQQNQAQRSTKFDNSIKQLVERGLRAQMQKPSLLTGKAIIALDFFPNQTGYIRDPNIMELPAIPSVPTMIDQAADLLRDIAAGLKDVPIRETITSLNQTLANMNQLLELPELQAGIAGVNESAQNVAQISQQLLSVLPTILDNVNDSSSELNKALQEVHLAAQAATQALEQVDGLLADGRQSLGPQSELQYEILQALQNIGQASKTLQRTAETIEQQPQSLIFGKRR